MGDWLHVGCLSAITNRYSDAGACARGGSVSLSQYCGGECGG